MLSSVCALLLLSAAQVATSSAAGVDTATAARSNAPPLATEETETSLVQRVMDEAVSGVEIHGFVSQGYFRTTKNELFGHSTKGTAELTEAGINFTKPLTDELRGGMQLFARNIGAIGDFKASFDWFYLDYRWRDWLGIRAGRVKLPFGLYNESSDFDSARVPILLPQSVYPLTNRDYLLAQTGAELYGYVPLGEAAGMEYRLYAGTLPFDVPASTLAQYTSASFETPYLAGGRVTFDLPIRGLRAGASVEGLRLDARLGLKPETIAGLQMRGIMFPAGFNGQVGLKIPAILWIVSAEYTSGNLVLATEYSRWHVGLESDLPAAFPESRTTSERFYVLGTYHARDWLSVGAYHSIYFPDTTDRTGRERMQHDSTLTLRFDINTFWLLKLEGHYMHGTALLDPALNGVRTRDELTKQWALFLAKTTLYF